MTPQRAKENAAVFLAKKTKDNEKFRRRYSANCFPDEVTVEPGVLPAALCSVFSKRVIAKTLKHIRGVYYHSFNSLWVVYRRADDDPSQCMVHEVKLNFRPVKCKSLISS